MTKFNKRQETIVATAVKLFDQHGYERTKMDEVADAVGVRKPTLYHYFSSKSEILNSAHITLMDFLQDRHEHRLRQGLEWSELLLEAMIDLIDINRTHPGYGRVFVEHWRYLDAKDQAAARYRRQIHFDQIQDIAQKGVDAGAIKRDDVRLVTLAVVGMCNWAYQWYRVEGALTPREIAQAFFEMIVFGLIHDVPAAPRVAITVTSMA